MDPNTAFGIGMAACAALFVLCAWLSSALTYSDGMMSAEGAAFGLGTFVFGFGFVACLIGAALN